jgi:L-threonylcarbamoyladenylate synthase
MKVFRAVSDPEVARLLRNGGIGVLRTDTLYGVLGRAADKAAVERIYRLKDRNSAKAPIVLVGSPEQLFDLPSPEEQAVLDDVWPGPVSVILPTMGGPDWVHRGLHSIAYRLPADDELQRLLAQTGPLIAPSANPEGAPPAMTIQEASEYFGDAVDFYVDGGAVTDETPSRLIRLQGGRVERLR